MVHNMQYLQQPKTRCLTEHQVHLLIPKRFLTILLVHQQDLQ